MPTTSLIWFSWLGLTLIFAVNCTSKGQSAEDDLETVARFKPTDEYFTASLRTLHFIIESSKTARIDEVFGKIISQNQLPTSAEKCKDGTYTGASPYDAYGYKHVVSLTIKGGKITAVDYDEVKKDGKGKQHDEVYCKRMSQSAASPAVAYPQYEQALVEKQDLLAVDVITGATSSLYRFRYATTLALIKASL